jgi:hypothetical protein
MTEKSRLNGGVARLTLAALLLLNTLMQLAGGAMMIARPRTIATDTFGISITADAARLVAVIGGATLAFALVSGTAAVGVLQRQPWARLPVVLLGAMLLAVGVVMLGQGLKIGNVDLAKGVVFLVAGLAYGPGAAPAKA